MSILNLIRRPTSTDAPNAEREKLLTRYRAILENDNAGVAELIEVQTIHSALNLPATIQQNALDIREAHRLADALKGADKRRAALDKAEAGYRQQIESTRQAIEQARAKLDDARAKYQIAYDNSIQDSIATDRASMLGGEVVGPIADRLKLPRTAPDLSDLPRDPAEVIAEVEPGHGEPRTVNQNLATALAGIA
jgi:multidrug efflux pump subunit AcrA (membrane-fusion protein)